MRPLWLGLVAVLLAVAAIAMQIAVPFYCRSAALEVVTRLGGSHYGRPGGPDWLRKWVGDARMVIFDEDCEVDLSFKTVSDSDLSRIAALPGLAVLNLYEAESATRRSFLSRSAAPCAM